MSESININIPKLYLVIKREIDNNYQELKATNEINETYLVHHRLVFH